MNSTNTIIIGAGAAGLSTSAFLGKEKIPYILLERDGGVGSSWRRHYDRLHLHTVKTFSHLPMLPFPSSFPKYVPRESLISYMELYAEKFHINPIYHTTVTKIENVDSQWMVTTKDTTYTSQNIVVATGYNHTPHIPEWKGFKEYKGEISHSREYKNGTNYRGKKVLVVGAGNTGAEVALDLYEYGAQPSICIRGPLRVVPRDLFGVPTQISALMLNTLPLNIADQISQFLLFLAVPDLSEFGIKPPDYGSLRQVKDEEKIPLIDIGTIDLIRKRIIHVVPGISEFLENEVLFENGAKEKFDSVILCTGYKPNLHSIFPSTNNLFDKKGYPIKKGEELEKGLYFAGFNNHITGFLHYIGIEAERISNHIISNYRNQK